MMFKVPEEYRLKTGVMGSTSAAGNNGAFIIGHIRTIASDGEGWEHVSVSCAARTPTWQEMCEMKALFWDEEDCVVQFHPPKSRYVNCHPHALHMWRKIGSEFETPPMWMVGPK